MDKWLKFNFRSFFRTGSSLEVRFREETEHPGDDVFGEWTDVGVINFHFLVKLASFNGNTIFCSLQLGL